MVLTFCVFRAWLLCLPRFSLALNSFQQTAKWVYQRTKYDEKSARFFNYLQPSLILEICIQHTLFLQDDLFRGRKGGGGGGGGDLLGNVTVKLARG